MITVKDIKTMWGKLGKPTKRRVDIRKFISDPDNPSPLDVFNSPSIINWELDWSPGGGKCPDFSEHYECRWCAHWLSYNDRQLPECPYCHKGDIIKSGG